jgi:hypothetical protein
VKKPPALTLRELCGVKTNLILMDAALKAVKGPNGRIGWGWPVAAKKNLYKPVILY